MNPSFVKKVAAFCLILLTLSFSAFPQSRTAELVVVNANVRTLDEKKPRAEALAVIGNRIAAVGSNAEIQRLIGAQTKIIDAEKRLVLPGFNDSHVHFLSVGQQFFSVDLRSVKSPAEIVEKLRRHVRFLPKGQWILGSGWNHRNWTPNDLPTRELIDAVTPDHPVFLYNSDPQTVLVNSLALKLAGLDKTAKAPPNGEIVRDSSDNPTGILKGSAVSLVKKLTPVSVTQNNFAVLETATNYAASLGVTSVQDVHSDDSFEIYRELARQGKLKTRVYDCVNLWDAQKLARKGVRRADGSPLIRHGCLKHFTEGDPDEIGPLTKEIAFADKADLQVMMHAIGARANSAMLTIYERVIRQNGAKDRRFRIEHAQNVRPADFRRFARTKTIASMQPALFFRADGSDSARFAELLSSNVTLAFGSDANIIDLNPLDGIFAAVYVPAPDAPRLTVEEAVRAYTLGAAFAEFQENEKGSLTVGKLADFVILSQDIFTVATPEIRQTKVLMTVMDGRLVFQNE